MFPTRYPFSQHSAHLVEHILIDMSEPLRKVCLLHHCRQQPDKSAKWSEQPATKVLEARVRVHGRAGIRGIDSSQKGCRDQLSFCMDLILSAMSEPLRKVRSSASSFQALYALSQQVGQAECFFAERKHASVLQAQIHAQAQQTRFSQGFVMTVASEPLRKFTTMYASLLRGVSTKRQTTHSLGCLGDTPKPSRCNPTAFFSDVWGTRPKCQANKSTISRKR